MEVKLQPQPLPYKKPSLLRAIKKDYTKNKWLILMALPVVAWYILFHYVPMYGVIIAFKQYSPIKGIWGSDWIGLQHFYDFFNSVSAWRVIRNTLVINFYQLIFGFPAPIILALLMNEIKNKAFKKSIQTITYLPHFVSTVVICGMIIDFFAKNGLINDLIAYFGGPRTIFLVEAGWFRSIYVGTGIWQGVGWGSIIYLAALTAIDTELYEAVTIDGAGRWKQFIHITLPGIASTIVILFIMNIGRMMSEGFEKVILLYNPSTYETADIISSFVYRRGLVEANYGFSAAVGLFNTVVNLILIVAANYTSRKVNETSLW